MLITSLYGVRFSCRTGEPKCVSLYAYLENSASVGRVIRIEGGPTGYESFCLDNVGSFIDSTIIRGWWACVGTEGRWDSLYISGLQMKKLFQLLAGKI